MNLSFEQIKEAVLGAAYVEVSDELLKLHRFNEAEEELYNRERIAYFPKVFTTAGIRLSFKTNSENLFLSFDIERPMSRQYFSVDVFVDGKMLGCIDNFSGVPMPRDYTEMRLLIGNTEKDFYLGEGEKTVTVYLPWSVNAMIKRISLDDGASVEAIKPKKKLLAYGDSITHGYDALRPSNRYISRLAEALDAEEYNKAIGGEVFFPALAKIKNDITPDYITVAYGTNDWNRMGEGEFIENCSGFYRALSENYPDSKIFAITPIWRADADEVRPFGEFSKVEEDIKYATKELQNVTLIKGYDFIPHENAFYSDLYLHPNEEGFEHYAKNIIKEIKDAL